MIYVQTETIEGTLHLDYAKAKWLYDPVARRDIYVPHLLSQLVTLEDCIKRRPAKIKITYEMELL